MIECNNNKKREMDAFLSFFLSFFLSIHWLVSTTRLLQLVSGSSQHIMSLFLYNPLCFLQLEDSLHHPLKVNAAPPHEILKHLGPALSFVISFRSWQ